MVLKFIAVLGLLAFSPRVLGATDGSFDIKTAPSQATWKYFLSSGPLNQQKLWTSQMNQELKLRDWAWQWRLAWIQACENQLISPCPEILEQALFDPAMVVRARAAEAWGSLFEGKGDVKVMSKLRQAFELPENDRNGKPLLVKFRILSSLWQVGGQAVVAQVQILADRHPRTKAYWQKLTAAM